MGLRLFLDSADLQAWRDWLPTGLFFGVTTNPTLLRCSAHPCSAHHLAELAAVAIGLGAREVHLQAWGASEHDLLGRARSLAAIDPDRIVVKLPVTLEGARVARHLVEAEVPVTFTACYEIPQVLIAAALGVRYIAPYLGRISDQGRDGHADVIAMQRCLDGVGSDVRLLVASLRRPGDLSRLAAAGLDTFTLSPAIAAELFSVEATRAAAADFERDVSAGGGPPAQAAG